MHLLLMQTVAICAVAEETNPLSVLTSLQAYAGWASVRDPVLPVAYFNQVASRSVVPASANTLSGLVRMTYSKPANLSAAVSYTCVGTNCVFGDWIYTRQL